MRHFGLEEANRLVPLLTATFDRVRPLIAELRAVSEAIEKTEGPGVGRLRASYRELFSEIGRQLEPLEEMGIEVKAADGLVDFRALLGGRTVYLCWRYGESQIGFWHDLQAGFSGRRPIFRVDDFAPSYVS